MSDSNIKIIKTDVSSTTQPTQENKKINFSSPPPSEKNPLINDENDLVEFNPDDLLEETPPPKVEPEENSPPEAEAEEETETPGDKEEIEDLGSAPEANGDEPVENPKISDEELNKVVEQYYRKKSAYDQSVTAMKSSIMSKTKLKFKQKYDEMRKAKAPCVKCGRAVGSIFKATGHFETEQEPYQCQYRVLEAKCGDTQSPCKLNVNIELGCYQLIPDIIQSDMSKVQGLRNETIKTKNDLLYDVITSEEAITKFNEIKQNMDVLNSVLDFYKTRYSNILSNKESDEDMKQLIMVLFEAVNKNQELCREYDKNQTIDNLKTVVENYRAIVEPNLLKVRNIKYSFCHVNFDEEEDTYSLVQYKVTPKQLEWNSDIFRDSSVVKRDF
jgi:hypothetical protein